MYQHCRRRGVGQIYHVAWCFKDHISDEEYDQRRRILVAAQFKVFSHSSQPCVADIGSILGHR